MRQSRVSRKIGQPRQFVANPAQMHRTDNRRSGALYATHRKRRVLRQSVWKTRATQLVAAGPHSYPQIWSSPGIGAPMVRARLT
jgi:hypothetical protein